MRLSDKTKFAYVAGLIDGEGNISLIRRTDARYKTGYQVKLAIGISNTNEWLIQWLKVQLGGSISCKSDKRKNRKAVWQWQLTDRKASGFLELVLPYLQIKRPQAELALKFQKARRYGHLTEKQAVLQEAQRIIMQAYNKKGPRDD